MRFWEEKFYEEIKKILWIINFCDIGEVGEGWVISCGRVGGKGLMIYVGRWSQGGYSKISLVLVIFKEVVFNQEWFYYLRDIWLCFWVIIIGMLGFCGFKVGRVQECYFVVYRVVFYEELVFVQCVSE